jgi:hypothetical protein
MSAPGLDPPPFPMRYSQTLPRDFLFRARHELASLTPSSTVHRFIARHSETLENTCMDNHFHPILHLDQPIKVYVPRVPPPRQRRPTYGAPVSPRKPRRTSARPTTSTPLTVSLPEHIRLHMNEPAPSLSARRPIRGGAGSERAIPVRESRSPRGERPDSRRQAMLRDIQANNEKVRSIVFPVVPWVNRPQRYNAGEEARDDEEPIEDHF